MTILVKVVTKTASKVFEFGVGIKQRLALS